MKKKKFQRLRHAEQIDEGRAVKNSIVSTIYRRGARETNENMNRSCYSESKVNEKQRRIEEGVGKLHG